jgi:hypothetical protein
MIVPLAKDNRFSCITDAAAADAIGAMVCAGVAAAIAGVAGAAVCCCREQAVSMQRQATIVTMARMGSP